MRNISTGVSATQNPKLLFPCSFYYFLYFFFLFFFQQFLPRRRKKNNRTCFQLEPLLHVLFVGTSKLVDLITRDKVKGGQVSISRQILDVTLIVVVMTNFDLIFGMDWLVDNHVNIDYHRKEVVFLPQS